MKLGCALTKPPTPFTSEEELRRSSMPRSCCAFSPLCAAILRSRPMPRSRSSALRARLLRILIETLQQCGVNRVSLGVQSFIDREAQSVGRLHQRSTVLEEIARLREAGLSNINIDLIAGLPHQTSESWAFSVSETIATGVPHVSVYMLEVDDDSRLGRELIAGGARYHAHFVPDDDVTADFYQQACEMLDSTPALRSTKFPTLPAAARSQ